MHALTTTGRATVERMGRDGRWVALWTGMDAEHAAGVAQRATDATGRAYRVTEPSPMADAIRAAEEAIAADAPQGWGEIDGGGWVAPSIDPADVADSALRAEYRVERMPNGLTHVRHLRSGLTGCWDTRTGRKSHGDLTLTRAEAFVIL